MGSTPKSVPLGPLGGGTATAERAVAVAAGGYRGAVILGSGRLLTLGRTEREIEEEIAVEEAEEAEEEAELDVMEEEAEGPWEEGVVEEEEEGEERLIRPVDRRYII